MDYWDNGHMDNGWGIVMVFWMLGIWALIALAIVWIVRSTRTPVVPHPGGSASIGTRTAEQILAERLARGEIDPEEYQARLNALSAAR